MKMIAYTDGACQPSNPGPGGWGFVAHTEGFVEMKEAFGPMLESPSTNQRAELFAAIKAIEFAIETGASEVEIFTDSMYVIHLVRGGGKVNRDLVDRLRAAQSRIKIKTQKVLAHSGVPLNERADRLAVKGAVQARRNLGEIAPGPSKAHHQKVASKGPVVESDLVAWFKKRGVTVQQKSAYHFHVFPTNKSPVLNYYPTKRKLYSTSLGTVTGVDRERLLSIATKT